MTQFTVGLDITLDNCHTGTYWARRSFFTEIVPILNVERINLNENKVHYVCNRF